MMFRSATTADIAQICRLETLPQFRSFVGSWPPDEHLKNLGDPDAGYIVAEDEQGNIAAFAILRGLLSEHRAVEIKRLVVGIPNQGTGKRFLTEIADRAFGRYGAHRLYLDVFVNNDRALHVYETFGFRKGGNDARCDLSGRNLPLTGLDVVAGR